MNQKGVLDLASSVQSTLPESELQRLRTIIQNFGLAGELVALDRYGQGHINDTYHLQVRSGGADEHYILQRINQRVFPRVTELMENISGVTEFLRKKLESLGRDSRRQTLTFLHSGEAKPYVRDEQGEYYRLCYFIEDSKTYNMAESAELMRGSGQAFGDFAYLLGSYPSERLHAIIPDFHNTLKRYEQFEASLAKAAPERRAQAEPEIAFYQAERPWAAKLQALKDSGKLPLRVTHNDTKLNNVLFDAAEDRPLCVIDLDTVMPGSYVDDFGDSIRFGASTAAEDCPNLDEVHFDLERFRAYTEGYLSQAADILSAEELEALPLGAMILTYECGMRFLADFLDGDHYFHVDPSRPLHNLERSRTQMKLYQEMKEQYEAMQAIVQEAAAKARNA